MNEDRDTLEVLARHLTAAMAPLRAAVSSEQAFRAFMLRLGWQTTGLPPAYLELGSAIAAAAQAVEALSDDPTPEEILDLLRKTKNAFEAIQGISTAPPGVDAGAFLAEIGERLFEILLTDYLASEFPAIFNLLSMLNVIEEENVDPTAQKAGHVRTHFKWQEIPKILTEPLSLPERVYGWGTPNLRFERLLRHLGELFFALKFPVVIDRAEELLANAFHETDVSLDEESRVLKVPFYYITIGGSNFEAAFSLLELKGDGGKLPGLVIQPQIPQEFPFTFHLAEDIDLNIRAGTDLASQFGVLIRPGEVIAEYPFQDGSFPSAGFQVAFDFHPGQPKILIGSTGGIRLEMQGGLIGLEVISVSGEFEVKIFSEIKKLSLILSAGNGDGFLQKILGDNETRVDLPLGIDWSSKTGFGFRGSMNFEIALYPHLSLGPIDISEFQLSLGVPSDPKPKIKLETGLNIAGDLGPLKFVVEEIGLGLDTTFEPGNLGPLDVSLGFKSPSGVGLAIDAGVVKGGGYLYFNREKEEYAGALELVFSEFLNLKAIGLITTRLPDGSKGFSLLIIITAEFGTGIQLGFGFVLLGVGGLLGLNRTLRVEPLLEGVRTGAINSVMFPTNVIENAPRIISDLRAFFPPEEGKFLIGPMAKLGWGTPSLITLSLGVIIEIPPGNVTILGVLKVALPYEDAALLVLQVNFLGRIEFDKQRAFFFAGLFESRVLLAPIDGEMGLLIVWSADANFVVTVGGFHPQFNPPPLPFPAPKRVNLSILNEPFGRIRVMAYFGVTSNTAQFGARAELYFGFSAFSVEGHLGFDALLQFSPFYFIIQVSSSVSLKAFGVGVFSLRLRFALEGPAPYRAKGRGSISLLFFDVSADFDVTWGQERNTTLPPIDVMPLIKGEFEKLENWSAQVPVANRLLVSLRKLQSASEDLVLHPVGILRISQRAVPLNLTLDKVGSQKPGDAKKFSLNVAPGGLGKKGDATELFAMAQFQEMEDAKKLSRPAYEPQPGGLELSLQGQQLNSSKLVKRIVRYEIIIIDTNFKRFARRFFEFWGALFSHFFKGSAVTKSVLSNKYQSQLHPFEEKIQVKPDSYTVAFNSNNQAFSAEAAEFSSEALAREFMKQQVDADPNLADVLHVIPEHEVRRAA